jgi:aspartyl-tRNA synthetase
MQMKRTVTCDQLRVEDAGGQVVLNGWVHRRRDHGGLIFVDLRDRHGLTQVVFNPDRSAAAHVIAGELRAEFVIAVRGEVGVRPAGTANTELATGAIELLADELEVLSESETPPFYINEESPVDETLRLQYRYLDLRRAGQRDNLILRHQVVKFMRDFFDEEGFLDIETPILIKSTPEGARDFLVPSRLHPGMFYALPQSPQQMKQILMIAGLDKYFQIARCFRDEDLRASRSAEFTQLDVEMSFIDEEDILELVERLHIRIIKELSPKRLLAKPFPRLTYAECLDRYGTDSPDMRFEMHLIDVTTTVDGGGFRAFDATVAAGGVVKAIVLPGCAGYSRKQVDELIEYARRFGAKGLISVARNPDGFRSPLLNVFDKERFAGLVEALGLEDGDLAVIVADTAAIAHQTLGNVREFMGDRLGLRDPEVMAFGWVLEFPLLEEVEGEDRLTFSHNPFCGVRPGDEHLLDTDPVAAVSRQYDLVCNGHELGGGSIRIDDADLQRKVFSLLGYDEEAIASNFGGMLRAFDFGVPPHGGIATGIDRLLMLLRDTENIREVVAFPKSQEGRDLVQDAPSAVMADQMAELGLELVAGPEAEEDSGSE